MATPRAATPAKPERARVDAPELPVAAAPAAEVADEARPAAEEVLSRRDKERVSQGRASATVGGKEGRTHAEAAADEADEAAPAAELEAELQGRRDGREREPVEGRVRARRGRTWRPTRQRSRQPTSPKPTGRRTRSTSPR